MVSVENFKKEVDYLRIEQQMSMRAIAQIVRCDPGTFSRYYNGNLPIPRLRLDRIKAYKEGRILQPGTERVDKPSKEEDREMLEIHRALTGIRNDIAELRTAVRVLSERVEKLEGKKDGRAGKVA